LFIEELYRFGKYQIIQVPTTTFSKYDSKEILPKKFSTEKKILPIYLKVGQHTATKGNTKNSGQYPHCMTFIIATSARGKILIQKYEIFLPVFAKGANMKPIKKLGK
jgi:hypothetical protein